MLVDIMMVLRHKTHHFYCVVFQLYMKKSMTHIVSAKTVTSRGGATQMHGDEMYQNMIYL